MEIVGALAHRWRFGVVAVEVLLAAGCVYFGWNAVAPPSAATAIKVHGAAAAPASIAGSLALPSAAPGAARSSTRRRTLQAPDLTADWLLRLNADDYDLYRGQGQTLQLLMSGVRRYLEQRVLPRLLGH